MKTSKGSETVTVEAQVDSFNWQRYDMTAAPLNTTAGHSNQYVNATTYYTESTKIQSEEGTSGEPVSTTIVAYPLSVATLTQGTTDPLIISQFTSVNQGFRTHSRHARSSFSHLITFHIVQMFITPTYKSEFEDRTNRAQDTMLFNTSSNFVIGSLNASTFRTYIFADSSINTFEEGCAPLLIHGACYAPLLIMDCIGSRRKTIPSPSHAVVSQIDSRGGVTLSRGSFPLLRWHNIVMSSARRGTLRRNGGSSTPPIVRWMASHQNWCPRDISVGAPS